MSSNKVDSMSFNKIDVNVVYDIHRRPLHDLLRSMTTAFIAGGCAPAVPAAQGITPMATWDATTLRGLPPSLGGTGADACVRLSAPTRSLAREYYTRTSWAGVDDTVRLALLSIESPPSPASPSVPARCAVMG